MGELVKFASQVDAEVLGKVRAVAKAEGRHLQALIEEALLDLLVKKDRRKPQAEAMAVYQASHARFASLYERLAK